MGVAKKNEFDAWRAKKCRDNITQDRFVSRKWMPESRIRILARCQDYVAILNENNQLSLYDISLQQKIWSASFQSRAGYHCYELKVMADGFVICISNNPNVFGLRPESMQLYFRGERVNEIFVDDVNFRADRLFVFKNRICGFGAYYSVSTFYEWDKQGRKIRQIQMDRLTGHHSLITTGNEEYFIATVNKMVEEPLNPTPVLIFHLGADKTSTFNICDEGTYIASLQLMNDRLLCGMHYFNLVGTYPYPTYCYPKLCVFNIKTGIKEDEYIIREDEKGYINHIITHHHYIVFCVVNGTTHDSVYRIDTRNKTLMKIKVLPSWATSNMSADSFSFTNPLLTICYSNNGYGPYNRYVIDLETGETVQELQYKRISSYQCHSFYSKEKLVIQGKDHLYIESFDVLETESEPESHRDGSMRMTT
jgi:hypothetical protein